MATGHKAQYLDGIAERTFKDLLASWIGPNYPGPASRIDPDLQTIEITHQMPSLSRDLGYLHFKWQIKAEARPPHEIDSLLLKCRCFRLDLGKSFVRHLMDIVQYEPTFYLALAIEKWPDDPSLPDRPPADRFHWYTIDLKQYCRKLDWGDPPSFIDIPVHNRLNLSMFSLLWGGNWVESYYHPLHMGIGTKLPPVVSRLVESFRTEVTDVAQDASTLLTEAVTSLEALSDIVDRNTVNNYTSRVAIVGSLRGVTAMLHASNGAERIENYCPEALGGSANLWLFSKTYHEFMRTSLLVGEANKRLLPVAYDNLTDHPRFFLATLFNARAIYRNLGAEVHLVKMLKEGGGDDYSYYSGAIGAFHWVHVDSDGHIALNYNRLSTRPDDRERLQVAEQNLLTESAFSLSQGGGYGYLRTDDLSFEIIKPVCLFPQEDYLLEHPVELWSSRRTPFFHLF